MDFDGIFENNISVYSLIESMSEGVIFINKQGVILQVNKKTNEFFGYSEKELIGLSIECLIPNRYKHKHKSHLTNYFSTPKVRPMGHSNSILSGLKKDGAVFPLEISLSYINTNDETIGVAFITDITARTKAENELKKRNLELDAYAHTIAHELHSQLNSIIGFSQLLLYDNELGNEKRRTFLEMIESSGYKMNTIIREMLLFANLKKEDIKKTDLPMKSIVEEAISRMPLNESDSAKIEVASNFEPSVGYGPWIEEVWYNYIRNAIKYGGQPPKIEIGSSKDEKGFNKFWVKDNGIGLSEEQCNMIFVDPHKLGDGFVKGHGLGLSIVKRIVRKLDGRVSVESTLNEGSVFSFYLPSSTSD